MATIEIPLNHGYVALIDQEDEPAVSEYHWWAHRDLNVVYVRSERQVKGERFSGYIAEAFGLAFPASVPPGSRFVLIHTVFLDESGTHDDALTLVIAGYFASLDDWIGFESEWNEVLADHDLTAFHMTDFLHGAEPYKGWTADRRNACFDALTGIISKYAWGGFAIGVPLAAYKKMVTPWADQVGGGPYGLVALRCFIAIADSLGQLDPDAQIAYVMEDGAQGKGQVLKLYELNKADSELRMLSLRFEGKERFVPLQAADMLAQQTHFDYTRC